MKFKIKWLLSLIFCVICSSALAETSSEELSNLLSNFHSMNANFKQSTLAKKGVSKKSSGTMALMRPGKFRWEITSPDHQIIIADGKYLWIYNVDLEQATQQSLTKDANSPAILLSGSSTALQERFVILKSKKNGEDILFELKPKASSDIIQWVSLQFRDNKLNEMIVLDNLGQKNIFRFDNVKINPQLPQSIFQFRAPKGVDIIKN